MIFVILIAILFGLLALGLMAWGLLILIQNIKNQFSPGVVSDQAKYISINGENILIEEGVLLNSLWAQLPNADCKEGECGGCRVKLLCGEVDWIRKPVYQLQDKNHILPCSCVAKTSLECELIIA